MRNDDNRRGLSGERACYALAAMALALMAPTLWWYGGGVLGSLIGAALIAGIPAIAGFVLTARRSR